jgi:hypothetical protein
VQDRLKQLPTTVADHAVCNLALPWIVPGNLVLQDDIIHSEAEAQGHIVVEGSAEHCRLESELGSVFLLYGSTAYTKIKAGINIFVKHSANSALTAGQDIIIEKSVIGSVLQAGRKVISESGDASIVGGRVSAGQEIAVYGLGNGSNTETEIVVLSPGGQIRFSRIFPGVRLKIGHAVWSTQVASGAGVATVRDGRLHVEYGQAVEVG